MAIVVGPLFSADARGAVGSNVYSAWRGLNTVRTRVTPANQQTQRRQQLRAITISVTQRWRILTDQQRQAWMQFADERRLPDPLNRDIRITGQNWYIRCNVVARDAGYDYIDSPPLRPPPPGLELLDAWVEDTTIFLFPMCYNSHPTETEIFDIWRSGPHSPGRRPTIKDAKHLAYIEPANTPYPDSVPGPGRYTYWCRVLDYETGLLSIFVSTYRDAGV